MLTVVVVNFKAPEMLERCLLSIRAAADDVEDQIDIVVVENGSGDRSPQLVRDSFPDVRLIELAQNSGFAGGILRGIEASDAPWIALVNNDAELQPSTLSLLLNAARARPDVGALTPQVRFMATPEVINSAGLEIDRLGVAYDRHSGRPADPAAPPFEVFGVSGCVALYRREMLDAVGGFDQSFFAYMEDADLAWRAQIAGWRALYVPEAVCHHHASVTARERSGFKYFLVGRNRVRMVAKNATRRQLLVYWPGMLAYDLAYVAFVALTDRTLAPLRGRLAGLREWRSYRSLGLRTRGNAPLLPATTGWRGALSQRGAYAKGGTRR